MPFKSAAQQRWGNSPSGHAALGDAGVAEWNSATKGKKLPEKVKKRSMKNGQVSEPSRGRMEGISKPSKDYGGKDGNNIPGVTS